MPNAESAADWSPAAERDVDEIWDYYAGNASEEVAGRLLSEIVAAVERVAAHPLHGRARAGLRPDLRSVTVSPYIVFYRIRANRIQVARVLHERRDLEAALAESEL